MQEYMPKACQIMGLMDKEKNISYISVVSPYHVYKTTFSFWKGELLF